jgi:1,4-dihydroxy-2-naphthoate octaprenyltransferase
MNPHRSWLAAARPAQALLAPTCVAVGSSYAHFDTQRGPGFSAHAVVTLGALAAALGVNLIDHAWDQLGAPPPESGEPDAAPLRSKDAGESLGAGVGLLAVAALCGLGLVPLSGSAAVGYGLLAVLLGVARGAPVVGLGTMGWGLGEIAGVVALGPLAATAGFASQAGTGSWGAFLAGIPAGLVAASALYSRSFTRRDADARLRRITPVIALGETEARRGLVALPLLAAAAVAVAVRWGEYGPWANAAALPLAVAAFSGWRLPVEPKPFDYDRWGRLALGCAFAALACIVLALRFATPE